MTKSPKTAKYDLASLKSPLGTIYTGPEDTFATLSKETGLDQASLLQLNPHIRELKELEPGIPCDVPLQIRIDFMSKRVRTGLTPYDIARREKALGVCENNKKGEDNPRIRLYHSTTAGGAEPDEVAWCSSFVNFCVEKSGRTGTDSKAARSWLYWGSPVPANQWREGDIVVFWRESKTSWKGHVGFLVSWDGERPLVLGGNQGNCLNIDDPYPFSRILSVRR